MEEETQSEMFTVFIETTGSTVCIRPEKNLEDSIVEGWVTPCALFLSRELEQRLDTSASHTYQYSTDQDCWWPLWPP